MAKVSAQQSAIVKISEEDWNKITEVYDMLNKIKDDLMEIGLELDSPEVKYESFGGEYSIGDQLDSLWYAIDDLECHMSGLY